MNIRLTQNEISGIVDAVKIYIKDRSAKLYLHGSRTKPELKGGDIDLLLLLDSSADKHELLQIKHYILAEIKKNIGDQKVDLIIADQDNVEVDEFIKTIMPVTVLLTDFEALK